MEENISLLSFSLDQVINANGIGSLEYVSSVLNPAEINLDQTYFVVTTDQLNIINQLEAPIYANGLEISRISGLNQGLNFVSLDQVVESDQPNVVLDHLAVENQLSNGLPKSIVEINATDLTNTLINNNNIIQPTQSINENRNSEIKVAGKLYEIKNEPISDAEFDHSLSPLDQPLLGEVETLTKVNKNNKTPPDIDNKTENKVNTQKKENSQHIWKCQHCPEFSFPTKSRYDRHRRKEHKPPPKIYNCTECELTFDLASRLKSHMLSVHLHYKPHKCDICGKTFSKLSDMIKHKNTHMEHSPGVLFPSKSGYDHNCHRAQEHRPPPKIYNCTECELTFELASRLKSHMLSVHLHYKPHKCDICGKTFSKSSDMRKHKNTHTGIGIKEYACPTCNKQFTDMSNLERHKATHAQEKPFKCRTCGKCYLQLSSLKKHRTKSQAALLGPCGSDDVETVKQYHCRTCGESFKYKKLLAEHDKKHRAEEGNKVSSVGRNVDALIQDILQEDAIPDLMQADIKMEEMQNVERIQSEDLAVIDGIHESRNQNHDENSFEIELINEIDRLEGLKTEAEGVSASSAFQMQADFFTGSTDPQMNFNMNCQYINQFETLPIVKEENICNVPGGDINFHNMTMESLPEDLLMSRETEIGAALVDNRAMDDCATIFESDVDLETSVNLAANLNQLIAENNVEFVSTEDDDTFIINLNSGIDAEQLSDLLNIGIEVVEPTPVENINVPLRDYLQKSDVSVHDPSHAITPPPDDKGGSDQKLKSKKGSCKTFRCKLCMKTFNKRDNYVSHLGVHDPRLCRHKCIVCNKRFGYRSTLNKHMLAEHTPAVWKSFQCELCGHRYRHKWMLKEHINRTHRKITPYRCVMPDCPKMFSKLSDFMYHQRSHLNERPYKCNICNMRFLHASHRMRHRKRCAEKTYRRLHKVDPDLCSIEMSKELLSDIEDLLKSKMSTASK